MTTLLSSPTVLPTTTDITATRNAVFDFLALRRDTTMLRLRSGADVMRCVSFPDEAAHQDGLIVMKVGADEASFGDGKYRNLLVLVNANKVAQAFSSATFANAGFTLHPVQVAGSNAVVKTATYAAAIGTFKCAGPHGGGVRSELR